MGYIIFMVVFVVLILGATWLSDRYVGSKYDRD